MRTTPPVLLLLTCLFASSALPAQQSAPSGPQTPQTATILQQSVAALNGATPITDVTLTGNITVTFGSVTQAGTIKLIATAAGQSEVVSTSPSGTGMEIRDISTGSPNLTVIRSDGTKYSVTTQSAVSPNPSWFFPEFILSQALSQQFYASSYVGAESRNGAAVQHVAVWPASTNSSFPGIATALTRHDIYLDASSFLPVAMVFNAHPYDQKDPSTILASRTSPIDHPEEVDFSDYQSVQGHPVAFHIHTIINLAIGPLVTDIQVSSVELNTGATISAN
jgi:hypothetical protein